MGDTRNVGPVVFPLVLARAQLGDSAATGVHHLTNERTGTAVSPVENSIVVVVSVTGITYAIPVRIGLVWVCSSWTIIHITTDTVPIDVIKRVEWTGVTRIANLVAVGVRLISIRGVGAVVHIVGDAVAVRVDRRPGGTGNDLKSAGIQEIRERKAGRER